MHKSASADTKLKFNLFVLKVVFSGVTGYDYQVGIALDETSITSGQCLGSSGAPQSPVIPRLTTQ